MILLIALLACTPKDTDEIDTSPPAELEIPGLDGIDLDALFVEAVATGITADGRVPWGGHLDSLTRVQPGCPDLYAGTPDLDIDGIDQDGKGFSWLDHCQAGTDQFGGYEYWENGVHVVGELTDPGGRDVEAARHLVGNGVISEDDSVEFEFNGESEDSLSKIEDSTGFSHVTYQSLVKGTVTGSVPFPADSETPGGYRTDMYLYYTTGDVETIEARGNVYYFDHRMAERFDSIAMDIAFAGPTGATPDVCTAEPRGWIGVRDEDAYWYDVVFEPRTDMDATDTDFPNDPYTSCDGCGTLYVRGIAQDVQVCPDLSFLWQGALNPPDPSDFALSIRDILEAP
jgi:hypothetical protein